MIHKTHRFPFILLGILIFANIAFAQNTSEISKLKVRISELEKRVATLEKMIGKSSSDKLHYSEKWKNRSLWRQLKTEMSMSQVESLSGTPRKISGGDITHWYYSQQSWHSYLKFYKGSLDTWTEPE